MTCGTAPGHCYWQSGRQKSNSVRAGILVEAEFQVLREEIPRHEAVFPDSDDAAVVNGKAQLRQRHVQLVHPTWTDAHTHRAHIDVHLQSIELQPVVKLLSNGARPERPKLEAEGPRPAQVRFLTVDQGFLSIQGTLFGFYGLKWCLMLVFYSVQWWIPAKMCRISTVRYRICYQR